MRLPIVGGCSIDAPHDSMSPGRFHLRVPLLVYTDHRLTLRICANGSYLARWATS
jgi:hypothetical protein